MQTNLNLMFDFRQLWHGQKRQYGTVQLRTLTSLTFLHRTSSLLLKDLGLVPRHSDTVVFNHSKEEEEPTAHLKIFTLQFWIGFSFFLFFFFNFYVSDYFFLCFVFKMKNKHMWIKVLFLWGVFQNL